MIHTLTTPDGELKIHRFVLNYETRHVDGLPAEHGAIGALDFEVHLDSQDLEAKNYRMARKVLWNYSVTAAQSSQKDLRRPFQLDIKQKGADGEGVRTFKFEGWVSKFEEHAMPEAGEGGREMIKAQLIVRARDQAGYTPEVK